MSSYGYYCHLASGMVEYLLNFAPVTLPLFMAVCLTLVWVWFRTGVNRVRVLVVCISPAIIPVCHLAIGVACVRPEFTAWGDGIHAPVPWFTGLSDIYPMTAMSVLAWLFLPLAVGLGWWVKRGWPVAIASMLWWGWVSVFASAMAEMSILGNWI